MAKTKPSKEKRSQTKEKSILNRVAPTPTTTNKAKPTPETDPVVLCIAATALLQENNIEDALSLANLALSMFTPTSGSVPVTALPALTLLGEIHVSMGEIDTARTYFLKAAELDPNGTVPEIAGGGAEKFLWLAQLTENGGVESVSYFQQGVQILRSQIQSLMDDKKVVNSLEGKEILEEKRRKLATALCGIVEVYMTDLSWEPDAESRSESLVTEATIVAGDSSAEPWQTLASVRISQERLDDAREALKRSMDIWKEGDVEREAKTPDFPTRVSLARLLVEAEMEEDAVGVVERLVGEDDEAVEVWYLGGWALYVLGEKAAEGVEGSEGGKENKIVYWASARRWLGRCLELFEQVGYEDARLGEHAKELVAVLDGVVGDEWEDEESVEGDEEEVDEDEEMGGC